MQIGYSLLIFFYRSLIFVASAFNGKAKLAILQRKESLRALTRDISYEEAEICWFHTASLGEFEQGLPIMEAYKKKSPKRKILVTFFSPSGYEHRKHHPIIDYCAYLPWDSPKRAKKFIELVSPKEVYFIKYEFWYFTLREIKNRNIPLYNISSRFLKNQIFFKPWGGLHRKMLTFFNQLFVQDEASLTLLKNNGFDNCSLSGDTRFDNVLKKAKQAEPNTRIEEFKGEQQLLIVGSAWIEDIEILNLFLKELPAGLKVLIAPHDISESNIARITKKLNGPTTLYTEDITHSKFLILNTIGHLFNAYQYGDFAFIGGAFGDGLHNILEATAFDLPVVFGNKGLEKFPEAQELIALKGAFSVNDGPQAKALLEKFHSDSEFLNTAKETCKGYMQKKKGATEVIMNYLNSRNGG